MLKEINNQDNDHRKKKKWYSDSSMDIVYWIEEKTVTSFQLFYDKNLNECCLTWNIEKGFEHNQVDAGDTIYKIKTTSEMKLN